MFITNLTYEGLDGDEVTKQFHFHLSKSEVLEVVMIEEHEGDFHSQLSSLGGNPRRVFAFFRDIMQRSVGERRGDQFVKTAETQGSFMNTGAYDAMFEKLSNDAAFAAQFVAGVVPKSLGEKAMADPKFRAGFALDVVKEVPIPEGRLVTEVKPSLGIPTGPLAVDPVIDDADVDAYFASLEAKPKEPGDYTQAEVLAMTNDEFKAVFGNDPRKWSKPIRLLAYRRAHNQ